MASRPVRTILTVVMDLLVIVAVILVLRVVVGFFGALASAEWAKGLLAATRVLVLPFGLEAINTPYGGEFDVSASLTVLALLGVEWALGVARRAS